MKKLLYILFAVFMCLFLMACEDNTPYIGENGNWWIGDEDLGVQAQGPQGEKGDVGEKGDKGDKGYTGKDGKNGESVEIVDITKFTEGLVDTYFIYFSDGTLTKYTVTNGENGEKGDKGDKGNTGDDGKTPYIGENGNWWIDNEDTGVLADYSRDDRKISDGLSFETISINGIAGMIVCDYDGNDADVVIPNYVGAVPVIAIDREAFEDNTKITSISFSKNMVYLSDYAFDGCTSLGIVDFNGAQIEKIPNYAFRDTALKRVELPEKTVYLGEYAFSGTYLEEINYQNITHFGSHSLDGYFGHNGNYVYLDSNVEYVGSYAFDGVFVYSAHASKPQNWADNIAGTSEWGCVTYGCRKNDEYIYAVIGTEATVHHYIGKDKRIEIPDRLSNCEVTKIGYGFGSIGGNRYKKYNVDLNSANVSIVLSELTVLEEVKIPDTVTEIDHGTFWSVCTMIFIPKSVNKMSYMDNLSEFRYYAFEGSSYPTFYDEFIAENDVLTSTTWLESECRTALEINPDKVKYNSKNKSYYYDELLGYSLLASMDYTSENLVVKSTFNGSRVYTIRSNAIACLDWEITKTIKIEDGITKIQSKAFRYIEDVIFIYIPKSVSVINAYGFDSNVYCDVFLIEANSKPSEWDSYWAGQNTSSKKIQYSVDYGDVENIRATDNFIYIVDGTSISLLKYIGSSSTVNIPRKIDGITVKTIKTGFYSGSGTRYFYIPNNITKIENRAFVNTSSSTFYLYCEAASQPSGWASDFYYNSYYSTTTNYKTIYFSRTFDY